MNCLNASMRSAKQGASAQGKKSEVEFGRLMSWSTGRSKVSERIYTAKLKDRDIKITSRDLAVFRNMHIEVSEFVTRMPELLCDQFIYDRIMKHCMRDFPDLQTWMNAEQTSYG